jgi:hypothetical protein
MPLLHTLLSVIAFISFLTAVAHLAGRCPATVPIFLTSFTVLVLCIMRMV